MYGRRAFVESVGVCRRGLLRMESERVRSPAVDGEICLHELFKMRIEYIKRAHVNLKHPSKSLCASVFSGCDPVVSSH